jgi:tetratricopeptide (TPR) repeat protein
MSEHIVKGIVDVPQSEVALLLEAGYLHMELGKWKEATEIFTGVAALVPHSDVPHVALGNLFFSQGKFTQALKAHREALKVNPDSALAQAHVGEALLFMKKTDEGLAELNRAIEMQPEGLAADFAKSLLEAHEVGCFEKIG